MPTLDSCINNVYEPGNIGASIGTPPVRVTGDSLYTPDDYPVDSLQYSLNFSKFYNSGYLGSLI